MSIASEQKLAPSKDEPAICYEPQLRKRESCWKVHSFLFSMFNRNLSLVNRLTSGAFVFLLAQCVIILAYVYILSGLEFYVAGIVAASSVMIIDLGFSFIIYLLRGFSVSLAEQVVALVIEIVLCSGSVALASILCDSVDSDFTSDWNWAILIGEGMFFLGTYHLAVLVKHLFVRQLNKASA